MENDLNVQATSDRVDEARSGRNRSEIVLDSVGRLSEWTKPSVGKYGIYVFHIGTEVVRVGETSSGCERISKGLKEPLRRVIRKLDRKNYMAYSWREMHPGGRIIVDLFELPADPFADNHLRRALEAEVTFQFRVHMGHWPRHMSEIHFLEKFRGDPQVIEHATRILAACHCAFRQDI
jgi:hypothetical protein